MGLIHVRNREARFLLHTYNQLKLSSNAVIQVDDQGHLDLVCNDCRALFSANEANSSGVYTKCCEKNKINVPIIENYHPTLVRLLDRNNQNPEDVILRRDFLSNIRYYNNTFSVASVNCQFDRADRQLIQ